MQNPNKRILIKAIVLALASAIVVSIAGLLLGWRTYVQFSDGFFWAGAVLVSLGLVNVLGARNADPMSGLQRSQSASRLVGPERRKIWASDLLRSSHYLALLGIAGLLLLGLSGLTLLVGRAL
jgi:hypothetical protein